MAKQNEQLLRKLPSIEALLKDPSLESRTSGAGRKVVANAKSRNNTGSNTPRKKQRNITD